jgi:hypothetical protein
VSAEVKHPEADGPASVADEGFGHWLDPKDRGKGAAASAPRDSAGAAGTAGTQPSEAPSPWAPRRAGRGPLSSVVQVPRLAAGRVARPRPKQGQGRQIQFWPLDRPAALCMLLVMALVVAGACAVYYDLRSLSALERLEGQNDYIREQNRSRNIIVQHLARQKARRLVKLRNYASWMDRRQEKGVIVFVPDGNGEPVRATVGKVDFGDLRKKVGEDINAIEHWEPAAPMQGYGDLRFQTAELVISRFPVLVLFGAAMVSLVVWSAFAYRNLPALGVESTSFRPRAVPLMWFVPPLNLIVPCAIMGEIWHGSDPRKLRDPGRLRLPLIGLWWPVVLGVTALTAMAVHQMTGAVGISSMVKATQFAVYGDLGVIVLGGLTLALVAASSVNQGRRYKIVSTVEQQLGLPTTWRAGYARPSV